MKTYDLKLTHEQLRTLQTILNQDIEDTMIAEPEIEDFHCTRTMRYWLHRAEVLDALNQLRKQIRDEIIDA